MFDTTLKASMPGPEARRRLLALPAALAIHALVLGVVAVGQLWAVDRVPDPSVLTVAFIDFRPPSPPPPPPPPPEGNTTAANAARPVSPSEPIQPTTVSSQPATGGTPDASGETGGVEGGVDGGTKDGVIGGVTTNRAQAPPPADQEQVFTLQAVTTPPVALRKVLPRYPELARRARVEGTVVLEAVIDRDGNVVDVNIVKDVRLGCGEAAREAVRSWRYEPATLNGRTVSVMMTVTVRFELGGAS